jgi:hypothetical protein
MTPLASYWPPGAALLSEEEGPKPDLSRYQCSTQQHYRSNADSAAAAAAAAAGSEQVTPIQGRTRTKHQTKTALAACWTNNTCSKPLCTINTSHMHLSALHNHAALGAHNHG